MSRLIISDFDRTLFDVNTFFLDFCQLVLVDENVKNAELRANIEEHINSGHHADWQHFMNRYHVDLQNIIGKVTHTLKAKSYLYPDVDEFLHRFEAEQVIIMTTGRQEFQEVKLQLVGEFSRLEKIIIPGNKGEYIKSHLRQASGGVVLPEITGKSVFSELYLIDDKVPMLEPLVNEAHVKLFHIARPDAKFPDRPSSDNITEIETLDEVQ